MTYTQTDIEEFLPNHILNLSHIMKIYTLDELMESDEILCYMVILTRLKHRKFNKIYKHKLKRTFDIKEKILTGLLVRYIKEHA